MKFQMFVNTQIYPVRKMSIYLWVAQYPFDAVTMNWQILKHNFCKLYTVFRAQMTHYTNWKHSIDMQNIENSFSTRTLKH